MGLWQFYKRWRLRRAQEKHAYWKAKKEALAANINDSLSYGFNPYNRNCYNHAAGQEAKYLERVEHLIRE